ncbi:HAMP domain-containing histidine kinase [Candidatus Peribacteria bacterium]|nr:HAMP domain-containing histidine kinase [Candidatus Peribacteria bacterium]
MLDSPGNIRAQQNGKESFRPYHSYFILVAALVLTLSVNFFLYLRLQQFFKENLQERLTAMVSTASLSFDQKDIDQIIGYGSINTPEYKKIVFQLRHVRDVNKNIRFAYLLRKTKNPNIFQFVADADSLKPDQKIDLNQDGHIDESDQLNKPGDEYDVSEFTTLREEGFSRPTVDSELSIDQWGTFLSSSAPIYANDGQIRTLIGIDVEVSDYEKITNQALVPYVLFTIFLSLLLTALTVFLVRIWKSKVEALNELDRQKDAVLHMVAHQFKGPVTTINFVTELLLDATYGELTKEQKENVTTIRNAAQKMGSQSEMVLDAAKITLGKLPLEPKPVDLSGLFKEIVSEAENHAKQLRVHLKVALSSSVFPTVIFDKKYTQLAFDNLLGNAIKYTALKSEGGNVDFTVEIRDNKLFCVFKDTGIGIPKAEQENVFKELYRASNAGKDGNGLGLHVSKGAIEAQGGKLWFESEEGKGTTFYIELPLVYPEKR